MNHISFFVSNIIPIYCSVFLSSTEIVYRIITDYAYSVLITLLTSLFIRCTKVKPPFLGFKMFYVVKRLQLMPCMKRQIALMMIYKETHIAFEQFTNSIKLCTNFKINCSLDQILQIVSGGAICLKSTLGKITVTFNSHYSDLN